MNRLNLVVFQRKNLSVSSNSVPKNHEDYKNVKQFTMGNGRGCIVTILRDPIERLMSEYFMLKLKHRQPDQVMKAAEIPNFHILGRRSRGWNLLSKYYCRYNNYESFCPLQYPSILEITSFSIEFHRIRWGGRFMHPPGDVKDETASHRAEHVKHMTCHM